LCLELPTARTTLICAARGVDGLLLGAGNVHTVEQAEAAVRGGGRFASAPATKMEVVHACRELELRFFGGAAMPSEIERLALLDLWTLRIFPAVPLGGLAFLRAVGPMYPAMHFIASGGIGPESLRSYLTLASVLAVCSTGLLRAGLCARAATTDRMAGGRKRCGPWLRHSVGPAGAVRLHVGKVIAQTGIRISVFMGYPPGPVAVRLALVLGGPAASSGRPDVGATTTQLGAVVREVAGDGAVVHQILQANPHEYEPGPDDIRSTVGAKLVVESGASTTG
jgi:2-dehydro-3-deoxyphosphogluconate aldolase/(4S)-4-hydroxy-2-oxoglutarate aldolase